MMSCSSDVASYWLLQTPSIPSLLTTKIFQKEISNRFVSRDTDSLSFYCLIAPSSTDYESSLICFHWK